MFVVVFFVVRMVLSYTTMHQKVYFCVALLEVNQMTHTEVEIVDLIIKFCMHYYNMFYSHNQAYIHDIQFTNLEEEKYTLVNHIEGKKTQMQ